METPDFFDVEYPQPPAPEPGPYTRPAPAGIWAAGERVTWVAGLVLMLSSFMDWYAGSGVGVKLAVIGWHTGVLALGALATIFVLIRLISIPDSMLPADGRGIGIWISLFSALGVILGAVLQAAEEL